MKLKIIISDVTAPAEFTNSAHDISKLNGSLLEVLQGLGYELPREGYFRAEVTP
jgi:hypothetical protein